MIFSIGLQPGAGLESVGAGVVIVEVGVVVDEVEGVGAVHLLAVVTPKALTSEM